MSSQCMLLFVTNLLGSCASEDDEVFHLLLILYISLSNLSFIHNIGKYPILIKTFWL